MKIKIYSVDQNTGTETFDGECDLSEALEPDSEEYIEAIREIEKSGRYWVGGGAAPLSLLTRAA